MLKQFERLIFVVDKSDIEKLKCKELLNGLKRLQDNRELLFYIKERVDIAIHGYNDNSKELYEIEQFKKWINYVFKEINGWAYFLIKDEFAQFLKLLMMCNIKFTRNDKIKIDNHGRKGRIVEIDLVSGIPLLENLFWDLNIFCEKHKINLAVNKELSANLAKYFFGEKPNF